MLKTMVKNFIEWFKSELRPDNQNVGCSRRENGEHE